MTHIKFKELKRLPNIQFLNAHPNKRWAKGFEGVSIDSRRIEPGQIFWALIGDRFDAHHFVSKAFEKSNSLCVVQKD
ncbi:MAG: hypothetical protein GF313_01555, partial [Caldithrix sp.]|nr:hypothetical protein [Caldithrix sp.]